MRIIEEYDELNVELIEIISAKYLGDYAIRIYFKNGFNRLVDFKPFLESSVHPSIRKYLDEDYFKQFNIIDGNLNWNDYDLIFPVDDLFNGTL